MPRYHGPHGLGRTSLITVHDVHATLCYSRTHARHRSRATTSSICKMTNMQTQHVARRRVSQSINYYDSVALCGPLPSMHCHASPHLACTQASQQQSDLDNNIVTLVNTQIKKITRCAVLCGPSNTSHCGSCPSVRPSVCPVRAANAKTKKLGEN